ncbi:guanylate kinase [Bowdeniella nasicola]|uniref:Guanylate kinase n=1 Tax=Bowdeniella nasicola TaxID=208480 RepID=A0A1Q5Q3B0_9ACTO|nr:guanylate kinase [Bowdeniella nasicola]OKL54301.1 guanylate kinase [Bowdeniella nasicola]
MKNAPVLVLVGPSGVGKGTVVAALRARNPQVWVSISATTRQPRIGEVDGVHYFFVTPEKFSELVDTDGMLEWAWVHQTDRYGTPRRAVEERIATGTPVILEIDLQGARQVRTTMPEAIFVFLAPPNKQELFARLRGRGTESEVQIQRRIQTAEDELAAMDEFDHVVVNDTIDQAVADLEKLLGLVH